MDVLPITLKVRNVPCLIVGGNDLAADKLRLLAHAGARITVVAAELTQTMREATAACSVDIKTRAFTPSDLDGQHLVFVTGQDEVEAQAVYDMAVARGVPVHVVDNPALCSFLLPSVVERAPVTIAVSSGGAAPILARLLRARLESLIPTGYGRLAGLALEFKEAVANRFPSPLERRRFWERILDGRVSELVFTGRVAPARQMISALLSETKTTQELHRGEIYLVGAGPGEADLLTFRALRLMQRADVVVYDRLVSPQILDLTRAQAERIYAGKCRGDHAMPQDDINALLVRLAKQGKRVLRLKGGDPFIFGRGGEEIETLAEHGIAFQVVPGITAAAGSAAYAGIPLTHRDYAQSCLFVTGHLKDGTVNLNWPSVAQPQQTLVIYMGLVGLPIICEQLIANGLPARTPAALVQRATLHDQNVLVGDLQNLPHLVAEGDVRAPTLIIVGEVVRLREKLDWFQPA